VFNFLKLKNIEKKEYSFTLIYLRKND